MNRRTFLLGGGAAALAAVAGAPALPDAAADPQAALARLRAALAAFIAFEGALAPHFAYGALDKQEYALAHALHVRDHLRLFPAPASA